MSAQFYGFRIKRDKLWELIDSARAVYREEHPLVSSYEPTPRNVDRVRDKKQDYVVLSDFARELKDDLEVELQLFEDGDYWLCRVLQAGWFWHNRGIGAGLTERFEVDTRTDPPEDVDPVVYAERTRRVERLDDEDLKHHRYLIVPIISLEMIQDSIRKLLDAAGREPV